MLKRIVLITALLTTLALAWTPEPNPDAFSVPANQWTKIAEAPGDLYDRELEPGQGAYLCYFPDSGLFYRYGGYTPTENNDLYSFSLAARKWVLEKAPDYSWPPPSDRPGAGPWWSMAYDGKRNVIWMMCGSGTASKTHLYLYDDIWKFDPAAGTFTRMNSTNFYHGSRVRIAYDSINDRILRAPAYDGEWSYRDNRDKTWCYDPNTNTWEGRSTPGSPKNALAAVWVYAKAYGKCVYMSRDTLVDSLNCELAVTWTYDYAANTWTRLNSTLNPPMRVGAAACWDPVNNLVIVHGGTGGEKGTYGYAYRGGGVVLEDTWTLDLSTGQWTPLLSAGKPFVPILKKPGGTPLLPQKPGTRGRLVFTQAADYDVARQALVVSSPYYGVWALRYQPTGTLDLPALPALPGVWSFVEPVFPQQPPNQRLLDLAENVWLQLNGGSGIGGGEVPLKYDETTGWVFKFGGCNNHGTTFASGYGNDLVAYDPAAEHWITVRPADPCGPARPANGCTRFYAHDPNHGCSWFAGGTSGNHLAAAIPFDWPGGSGTWRYDCGKDKFELVPSTGVFHGALGVICGYDRVNDLFITPSQQNWGTVAASVFNTNTHTWSDATTELHAQSYTYADFADSIGKILVMEGATMWGLDPVAGQWNTVSTAPASPTARPAVAYDCYNNVCLVHGINSRTYIYNVRTGAWTDMAPDSGTPNLGEHLAFDRRHGVFLGGDMNGPMYAYKYKDVPGLKTARPVPRHNAVLLSASPNPFVKNTRIRFNANIKVPARIAIYDMKGRMVKRFSAPAGPNVLAWDGRDSNGKTLCAGLYVVRLSAGKTTACRPIFLIK
jgi:hypothetical protein